MNRIQSLPLAGGDLISNMPILAVIFTANMISPDMVIMLPAFSTVFLDDRASLLISRIKEEQETHGFAEGLYRGMGGSGYVVTALGIILAASLGSLGPSTLQKCRHMFWLDAQ